MAWGDLPAEGQTLSPLTPSLKNGLTAITVLSFISFTASSILFTYLSFKLATWHLFIKNRRRSSVPQPSTVQRAIDVTLGIDGIFTNNEAGGKPDPQEDDQSQIQNVPKHPNQFLVLILNLLLADMHQGMAFLLNVEWLRSDGVIAGTPTCFAQGLFVSLGDLSSSMFISTIAVHTYISVVLRRRIRQSVLYAAIVSVWIFVYAISFLPIAATLNGAEYGGFFVRAGTWCWMNNKYEHLRLLTHYLFIFIALAVTSVLYISIFLSIRKQERSERDASKFGLDEHDNAQLRLSHNPAFLIYPVIYVLCTLPLATGRIATMAGADVPLEYFCFAGAMIASNGSFDCLLFGSSRSVIVFASRYEIDTEDVGLGTFAFMKTPANNQYGNMISIQGGQQRASDAGSGGWWPWKSGRRWSGTRGHGGVARTSSQESLRGPAIHMDTVTTVVVETNELAERDPRCPGSAVGSSISDHSMHKGFGKSTVRMM